MFDFLHRSAVPLMGLAAFAGCDQAPIEDSAPEVISGDPIVARALSDPLMIDPDLSWVNHANAAITYDSNHALPAFGSDPQAASRARDAARIELRDGGVIEELPEPESMLSSAAISGLQSMREILRAAGAPPECMDGASDDLNWAAKMPDVASIMPHGMVQQAAGLDRPDCALRLIRYTTQTDAKDALQYHFTKASRTNLEVSYQSGVSELIKAEKSGEKMFAEVNDGPGGVRTVTLVHWAT